jgi:hypothetical protein
MAEVVRRDERYGTLEVDAADGNTYTIGVKWSRENPGVSDVPEVRSVRETAKPLDT